MEGITSPWEKSAIFTFSLDRGKKMRQTCLGSSEPMMLPDQTDACPDGGVECLQRPSTAGGSSAVRESCRSAGKRMFGATLADRSVGDWVQEERLTRHGADGSNGHLNGGGASLVMAGPRWENEIT